MASRVNKYQVVTIGGATRDIMFYSSEGELIKTGNLTKHKLLGFEYGAKIVADKIYYSFGGGAVNTASTFAKLGLKTAAICRLGQDENGCQVIKNMKTKKIATEFVKKNTQHATGFSMILTVSNQEKEHIIFAHRGANDFLSSDDVPITRLNTDWLYVSSLPENNWDRIIRKAGRLQKPMAFNPGSRQLADLKRLKTFLPKLEVLILNRDEASEFRKLKDIKGLIKYIHGLGPKLVVVTDGKAGAYVYDGHKYYFMKSKATKVVDTVGAGDAFASAFTAGLIYAKTIKEALRWGMLNSASVISQIGAQNGILAKYQLR